MYVKKTQAQRNGGKKMLKKIKNFLKKKKELKTVNKII